MISRYLVVRYTIVLAFIQATAMYCIFVLDEYSTATLFKTMHQKSYHAKLAG